MRGLLDLARQSAAVEDEILSALSTKDTPALQRTVSRLPAAVRDGLLALGRLSGGLDTLEEARRALAGRAGESGRRSTISTALSTRCGADEVSVDLADLHGYRYHNGVTFAVHAPELPGAVLRGGRYDGIGKAFGRARPAVGFSIYLRDLVGLLGADAPHAILAPADDDAGLARGDSRVESGRRGRGAAAGRRDRRRRPR